jgi:hypothetical protein
MMGTKKGIVLGALFSIAVLTGVARSEPSYLVYPNVSTVFQYDTGRYDLVTSGNPKFNSQYAVAGQMLWDRTANRIPIEIYRAPLLTAFEPSPDGLNHFVVAGNDFDVIIDGFSASPHTLGSLCLRFRPEPYDVTVQLDVNGEPQQRLMLPIPAMEVTTPLPNGFFSDVGIYHVHWLGANRLQIMAFSDKNANGTFDGTPAYTIVAHDVAVSVETTTWGHVKALYR